MIIESFSHRGRVRHKNEDALHVNKDLGLFVVADGMGGHPGGDIASELAVKTIADRLGTLAPGRPHEVDTYQQHLAGAITAANATVYVAGQKSVNLTGMGTTVAAVLMVGRTAIVEHVGDSRVYLLRTTADGLQPGNGSRDSRLFKLTKDHTVLQEYRDMGMSYEEARNVLTDQGGFVGDLSQALGVRPTVIVSVSLYDTLPGDILLLCTDGLYGEVPGPELGPLLLKGGGGLLETALEHGGRDNVTGIVVRL